MKCPKCGVSENVIVWIERSSWLTEDGTYPSIKHIKCTTCGHSESSVLVQYEEEKKQNEKIYSW